MSPADDVAPPQHAPWSELKRALDAAGFKPSRALGQNFLVDDNMLRAIVRDAQLEPGARVVEIGPGCGVLTAQLVAAGLKVVALELDERLYDLARAQLAGADVEWILGDALAGKHELNAELLARLPLEHPWHLVSNLPYSAGTPILVVCSRLARPPQTMTVLVQSDLAERIAAAPGSKTWGALSARLQACYRVRRIRSVPRQLFWPRPQVESAVVRLEARADRPSALELAQLDRLLALLFQQRRKTVLKRLEAYFGSRERAVAVCAALAIDPRLRPENLTLETLLALVRAG